MGLAWQQGPHAPGAIGQFLVPDRLPERLLYAEPLRRRMRVQYGGRWIVDSQDVVLLHEPGHYPVAFFPLGDVVPGVIETMDLTTTHRVLGTTQWYTVTSGDQSKPRAAWSHPDLPSYASVLAGRIAFAWRAMDAFYEEDERIVGHAADPYHRIDIRQTSRRLVVRTESSVIAESTGPLVLFESGFAPRWYVPAADVNMGSLKPIETQSFCPYKGICSYYEIEGIEGAAWSYPEPYVEVKRIGSMISFEADKVDVSLDGVTLRPEPGQVVISHGEDRNLTVSEVAHISE